MVSSLQVLFESIVDYAGLFPPAQLSMEEALHNYIQYQSGPFAWMLGAFLLPVSRYQEFQDCAQQIRIDTNQLFRWPVHLLFSPHFEQDYDLEKLSRKGIEFTMESNQAPCDRVKALEFPTLSIDHLTTVSQYLPKNKEIYFEVPLDRGIGTYLARIKSCGYCAKVRLGGLTPPAFPTSEVLSQFLMSVARLNLPFKATAGLHYLLPGRHLLNPLEASPNANMHGFLNLAVATAMLNRGSMTIQSLINVLERQSLNSFQFDQESMTVSGESLSGDHSVFTST